MQSLLVVSAILLTTISLSSCSQTNRLAASKAVQQQNQTIKEIVTQAETNERLADQLPAQPKECGQRTTIEAEPSESYAKLSTRLFLALRTSNDVKIACYRFNEKIRQDRKNAYARSS